MGAHEMLYALHEDFCVCRIYLMGKVVTPYVWARVKVCLDKDNTHLNTIYKCANCASEPGT